ncbi:helix-turn-helix domain-containing protein [Streptomyces sp. NPDC021020]|uniref:helix-turn-helix domain-containing protein n=1 Tax=Streptomyces sp. NPDC021020 TaxID=3365109 RepID=UPI0037A7BD29
MVQRTVGHGRTEQEAAQEAGRGAGRGAGQEPQPGPRFGEELRRLREAAGMSLRALAREAQSSPAHISRIERGLRQPGRALARLCDRAVDARGRLLALLPGDGAEPAGSGAQDADADVPDGADGPVPWVPDRRDSAAVAAAFGAAAWHLRVLGRQVPAHVVLPSVAEQARSLREIALTGHNPDRTLLRLAAHTAEFAGWMAQESGLPAEAARWTAEAGRLASLGRFHDLRAYSRVRQAELAMYAGSADTVVELCERVRHGREYGVRVRAFAAQRAAQGHAMRGEVVAAMRALEQARELWSAQPDERPDALLIGSAAIGDPGQLVTGWCWTDLGRPRLAAELLHSALGPAHRVEGRRIRALFGARAARALAEGGEVQEAVELGRRALRAASATHSATARGELRLLAVSLERAPRHRPATDLVQAIRALPGPGGA